MKKILFVLVAGMFLLAAGFGVFLRPLLYTLTPLQRYYLGAYLACSWHETDPATTSEIQWIWKFKPAAGSKKSKPNLQYALATQCEPLCVSVERSRRHSRDKHLHQRTTGEVTGSRKTRFSGGAALV